MVIPERTRRVHKLVVPFFLLKFGAALCSLGVVFLLIIGIDYIHVLGRIAENKQLKGENFKLRQEIQLIRNKVDSMETTIERVRNYAKKLQILTGQGEKGESELAPNAIDGDSDRVPASQIPDRHSALTLPPGGGLGNPLDYRVDQLQTVSYATETSLTKLQVYLLARSAILSATPSLLPIAGWMSSSFGYRRNPYDGSFKLHAGVDLAADPGTPVRAPAPATVVFSGVKEGYGKVIVLSHGYGISTVFAHLSKIFVNAGEQVKRGEIISEVGSTGHSTGPHLHYEIRKNGRPVNPITFLSRARF